MFHMHASDDDARRQLRAAGPRTPEKKQRAKAKKTYMLSASSSVVNGGSKVVGRRPCPCVQKQRRHA